MYCESLHNDIINYSQFEKQFIIFERGRCANKMDQVILQSFLQSVLMSGFQMKTAYKQIIQFPGF